MGAATEPVNPRQESERVQALVRSVPSTPAPSEPPRLRSIPRRVWRYAPRAGGRQLASQMLGERLAQHPARAGHAAAKDHQLRVQRGHMGEQAPRQPLGEGPQRVPRPAVAGVRGGDHRAHRAVAGRRLRALVARRPVEEPLVGVGPGLEGQQLARCGVMAPVQLAAEPQADPGAVCRRRGRCRSRTPGRRSAGELGEGRQLDVVFPRVRVPARKSASSRVRSTPLQPGSAVESVTRPAGSTMPVVADAGGERSGVRPHAPGRRPPRPVRRAVCGPP